MIELHTKRLIIRDPISSDLDGWHRLMSDSITMYYLQDIRTHSIQESQYNLHIAMKETQNPNRTKYFFTIENKHTGRFMGTIGYTVEQTTPLGKFVGIGYFLLPVYHRQGYMTEALDAVVRFAFEEDNVYRINTGCIAENIGSERVMQKCGFVKEGVFRSYVWHDGRIKDRVEYGMLKVDWLVGMKVNKEDFWANLDQLVATSEIIIDRPKGSAHPRFPSLIYPQNYGYLKDSSSMDGGGIDIWRGTQPVGKVDAIMCIVDLMKRDSEIKILIGCTEEEKMQIFQVHNESDMMKGILIHRG